MGHLGIDFRHAWRALRRRPFFSLIVVLTMAVGIGCNVGIYAYLSYYLDDSLDAPDAGRVVQLKTRAPDNSTGPFSYPDALDLRERTSELFSQVAVWRLYGRSLKTSEKTVYAWGHAVSGDYFALFGKRPQLGRFLGPADDQPGAPGVVVLHHTFWKKYFDGEPSVIGKTVYLDGRLPYEVVGVTGPKFQGQGLATGIYVPLATAGEIVPQLDDRESRRAFTWVRLAPGVTDARAQAALDNVAAALDEAYPEADARRFTLYRVSDWDGETDPIVNYAKMLMVAVSLLLGLAIANVANLMLARAAGRQRETAIHTALGSGRWRLARRLLAEGLLLAFAGGVLGLGLARAILHAIESYLLKSVPIGMGDWGAGSSLDVDLGQVTLFFVAVTFLSGLLFGAAPAVRAWRVNLVEALKSDASSAGRGRGRLGGRQLLVVVQVALAVVLLLGAGLLVRTLLLSQGKDLRFSADDITVATVYIPQGRGASGALYEEVREQASSLPGVESVTLVSLLPLAPWSPTLPAVFPESPSSEPVDVGTSLIGPSYFETLDVSVLSGRGIESRDDEDAPRVAVVNQAAVEKYWPGQQPLGRFIRLQDGGDDPAGTPYEVVGVAADYQHLAPHMGIEPLFYLSFRQRPHRRMSLLVRSASAIGGRLHEMLHDEYPEMAVIDFAALKEQMRRSLVDQRMSADLASGFGAVGLLLAGLGIFAVMSLSVTTRARELGIRMAIGATRETLTRQILGEAARLLVPGLLIGVAAAVGLTRLLQSMLHGVGAHDPVTFVTVPVLLASVATLAAWLPARRAGRVDPMTALREE